MTPHLKAAHNGMALPVQVSEKLIRPDYERFVSEFERLTGQHGKLSLLFEMTAFHGCGTAAMREDAKFSIHRFDDIEKIAMVGEARWQQGMAVCCKPFTKTTVRYFNHADAAEAGKWLRAA